MPGSKKWDTSVERDLAIAIIFSQQGDKVKYDWQSVHDILTKLGYGFSKDAISQHWTKSIMKEFKNRHGNLTGKSGLTAPPPTPSDSAKKTPTSGRKRSKAVKSESDDDLDETPTKKSKLRDIKNIPSAREKRASKQESP